MFAADAGKGGHSLRCGPKAQHIHRLAVIIDNSQWGVVYLYVHIYFLYFLLGFIWVSWVVSCSELGDDFVYYLFFLPLCYSFLLSLYELECDSERIESRWKRIPKCDFCTDAYSMNKLLLLSLSGGAKPVQQQVWFVFCFFFFTLRKMFLA